MISYFVIAQVKHIPVLPVETSLMLGGAQAFMTLKWALNLVFFSRKHHKAWDQARLLD